MPGTNLSLRLLLVTALSMAWLGCGSADEEWLEAEAHCSQVDPPRGTCTTRTGSIPQSVLAYFTPSGDTDYFCLMVDVELFSEMQATNELPCLNGQLRIENQGGVLIRADLNLDQERRIRVSSRSLSRHTVSLLCEHGFQDDTWTRGALAVCAFNPTGSSVQIDPFP